jgi:hypothetical protein
LRDPFTPFHLFVLNVVLLWAVGRVTKDKNLELVDGVADTGSNPSTADGDDVDVEEAEEA